MAKFLTKVWETVLPRNRKDQPGKHRKDQPDVVRSGKRPTDIPCLRIRPLTPQVRARFSGPDDGLCGIHTEEVEREKCNVCKESWRLHDERVHGIALSLYNTAKDGCPGLSGDPVADVFGVMAFRNGGLLSVADGEMWGEKSRLAARCAVHGSLAYLQETIENATTTQEVVAYILRSFDAAQKLIIQRQATMTTLCTACICQLKDGSWGLCVVNVGDSLMYVFSPSDGVVREVTSASHNFFGEGDRWEVGGGALGPYNGNSPDLRNLTCSFTVLEEGDVVFGTSDGVSDNFDPVVIKQASALSPSKPQEAAKPSFPPDLTQAERAREVQNGMADVLNEELAPGEKLHPWHLTSTLLRHVVSLTEQKRGCLENANTAQDAMEERDLVARSRTLPGKLDHATVAAFEVGLYPVICMPEQERYIKLRNELKHF